MHIAVYCTASDKSPPWEQTRKKVRKNINRVLHDPSCPTRYPLRVNGSRSELLCVSFSPGVPFADPCWWSLSLFCDPNSINDGVAVVIFAPYDRTHLSQCRYTLCSLHRFASHRNPYFDPFAPLNISCKRITIFSFFHFFFCWLPMMKSIFS